jgi:hypothetical protein
VGKTQATASQKRTASEAKLGVARETGPAYLFGYDTYLNAKPAVGTQLLPLTAMSLIIWYYGDVDGTSGGHSGKRDC